MKKFFIVGVLLLQLPAYSQTYYPQPPGWGHSSPTREPYTPKPKPECRGSEVALGALAGGGISAAISKKNAYGWSIPLGTVIGGVIGRLTCK